MFLLLQCDHFPLTDTELQNLWDTTRSHASFPDEAVTMQCVDTEEITRLNGQYRGKNAPTNILTFSYGEGEEHDVAICLDVVEKEALERGVAVRDYVALVVVHALLHVCGMDHEISKEESLRMQSAEREILMACGFVPKALSDVY